MFCITLQIIGSGDFPSLDLEKRRIGLGHTFKNNRSFGCNNETAELRYIGQNVRRSIKKTCSNLTWLTGWFDLDIGWAFASNQIQRSLIFAQPSFSGMSWLKFWPLKPSQTMTKWSILKTMNPFLKLTNVYFFLLPSFSNAWMWWSQSPPHVLSTVYSDTVPDRI